MKKIIILSLLLSSIFCLAQKNNITVLTIGKSELIKEGHNQVFIDTCKSWSLTKKNVLVFFMNSKQLNSYEINSHYYHLPCEISGKLKRNDTIFDYFINAGGTARLVYGDKEYLYGCSDSICTKLVLMPPDGENE